MPDVGESINPPFPLKNQKHTEVAASIVDIQDGAGTSIMGGGTEYDPKQNAVSNGQKTIIKYQVQNQSAAVSLFIEPDPGNTPALNYYPILAKVFDTAFVDPGQYTMEWDGRCPHDGNRYIIQGAYKVHLLATCMACGIDVRDVKDIKVKKPCAHLYALPEFTGDLPDAQSRLTSLSGGTQFEIKSSTSTDGPTQLVEMHEEAAFSYWSVHGLAGLLLCTDRPVPRTGIVSEDFVLGTKINGIIVLQGQTTGGVVGGKNGMPDHALDDVFAAVLSACLTAKSPAKFSLLGLPILSGLNLPDAMYQKGADTTLGFKVAIPITPASQWARDFFDELKQGSSVGDAARVATSNITNPAVQEKLTATIYGNSGAPFLPARYGRKKD
ncbi:MAG TPA: hypothetical protein VNV43_12515 [Candidatus Acidoferrales bacterium]|jgi:hypothetical protein|nr:hypothetical protein [Candidatus Acidoferrales bacterium]